MRGRSLVVVFLATVGMVLLFWALVPGGWTEEEATDYRSFYLPVAQNLAEGRGLVTSEGDPAVRYPLGFPLLLAGLFGSARWTGTPEVLWLQGFTLLAMGWAAVGLCGLAWMVVGECGALVAAGLWMTYPFNLWLTKQPNSELLFLPLFYGALLLCGGALWRSWSWS